VRPGGWDGLLDEVGHRPWPLPTRRWLMTMRWLDLLFAHWPVDPEPLARAIPQGLELETWDGAAWLGVVPFRMNSVGPRHLGWLPGVSRFAELNVRTYVRAGGRAGVWFFGLDATSMLAVEAARLGFHLPYFRARIELTRGPGLWIGYRSRRTDGRGPGAEFRGRYRPTGPVRHAEPGSFEHFLTERYCLYAADSKGRIYRGEVHHPPWPLQGAELVIEHNTMGETAAVRLDGAPSILHFSERLDVLAWGLAPVG